MLDQLWFSIRMMKTARLESRPAAGREGAADRMQRATRRDSLVDTFYIYCKRWLVTMRNQNEMWK